MAARIAMIAMTTSSSINVNACRTSPGSGWSRLGFREDPVLKGGFIDRYSGSAITELIPGAVAAAPGAPLLLSSPIHQRKPRKNFCGADCGATGNGEAMLLIVLNVPVSSEADCRKPYGQL